MSQRKRRGAPCFVTKPDLPRLAVRFPLLFLLLLVLFPAQIWHNLQFYITYTLSYLLVSLSLEFYPPKRRRPPLTLEHLSVYPTIPHEQKAHTRNTCIQFLFLISSSRLCSTFSRLHHHFLPGRRAEARRALHVAAGPSRGVIPLGIVWCGVKIVFDVFHFVLPQIVQHVGIFLADRKWVRFVWICLHVKHKWHV